MADGPITSLSGSLGASGANVNLRFLASRFVAVGRNQGSPLKFVMDVGNEGEFAVKGEKVGVLKAPTVTSTLETDGNDRVLDDSTGETVDVTLNKHRTANFSTTLIAQSISGNYIAQARLDSSIKGLLNDIEADVFSAITSGITTNSAGTYNTSLDRDAIVSAVYQLDNQKAPTPRIGLVRHDIKAWGALSQLAGFEQHQYTGEINPNVMPNGGQGRLWHNTYWYKTQAMPKNTNNIDNLVFTPEAIAVAMRALPLPTPGTGAIAENVYDAESGIAFQIVLQRDNKKGTEEVIVHALYGYNVVKENFACLLKS